MSHNRSGEIANIDELNPGQEYYIISAHWGAALHASKVGDKVDMTTGHGGAWNPGESGGEKWTIQRADGGYNIRSVEHGSYLGFHHAEIDSAGIPGASGAVLTGAQNASAGLTASKGSSAGLTASKGSSAGLTASKEPFAWTVEPQDKGDGVFRFTVPHTEVHVDFSSVASVDQAASGITTKTDQTTEADFAASESDEAAFARESDEAAFAREMAAAGHNFDPNFNAGGGGVDPSFASGNVRAADEASSADADSGYSADAELNAGGSVEANGGGSAEANGGGVEANGGSSVEEGAGPTLHAFGRPYGFPPGYFSK